MILIDFLTRRKTEVVEAPEPPKAPAKPKPRILVFKGNFDEAGEPIVTITEPKQETTP